MDIGLFDSGIGGLTVLQEIIKLSPNNKFIYLADTANLPYGDKTQEQILSYADAKIRWMKAKGVDMVSIACNTTDAALSKVDRSHYNKMFDSGIVNIMKPTVKGIIAKFPNIKRIGILATEATSKSGAFYDEFKRLAPEIEVITISCPGLVPWIESDEKNYELGFRMVTDYMIKLFEYQVQGLIYGCTHYLFLSEIIKEVILAEGYNPIEISEIPSNNSITLLNPGLFVAFEVKGRAKLNEDFQLECYVTESSAKNRLEKTVEKLFGFTPEITLIDLNSY